MVLRRPECRGESQKGFLFEEMDDEQRRLDETLGLAVFWMRSFLIMQVRLEFCSRWRSLTCAISRPDVAVEVRTRRRLATAPTCGNCRQIESSRIALVTMEKHGVCFGCSSKRHSNRPDWSTTCSPGNLYLLEDCHKPRLACY